MNLVMHFLCIWTVLCYVTGCGTGDDVAGAGGQTTNGIAGTVKDIKGHAAGVVVTLYPEDFNPVTDPVPDSLRAITDGDGKYFFKVSNAGTYNIQALHPENHTTALIPGIEMPESADTVIAIPDTYLQEPASVTIHLSEVTIEPNGYLHIPGTGISTAVTFEDIDRGYIVMDALPAAQYAVIHYTPPDDSAGSNILEEEFEAQPGETAVQGPFAAWSDTIKITINTSSAGADITGDVYNFPLLVRLDASVLSPPWGDGGGKDLRFTKSDGITTMPFEIERWDPANEQAEVWVKIDTIFGNNSTQYIYLYTGNSSALPQSSGSAVFSTDEGFAGVWHMHNPPLDGSGDSTAVIQDATLNANHGSTFGEMTTSDLVEGMAGPALNFDGKDDYIDMGTDPAFDILNQVTLEAWIKPSRYPDTIPLNKDAMVIAKQDAYTLEIQHDGAFQSWIRHQPDTTGPNILTTQPSTFAPDQWYHAAAVYDGTDMKMFLNGSLIGTRPTTGIIRVNTYHVRIGDIDFHPNTDRFFPGVIDEARISHTARSAGWVKLSFENQKEESTVVSIE